VFISEMRGANAQPAARAGGGEGAEAQASTNDTGINFKQEEQEQEQEEEEEALDWHLKETLRIFQTSSSREGTFEAAGPGDGGVGCEGQGALVERVFPHTHTSAPSQAKPQTLNPKPQALTN
jgi:hypothetical protein